ncbi:hypothetical protein [Furfurilactobacillus siliginis]|nr:hypothetical protein [Furfurilactobacillus siliginis]GEK29277.1 hypothetical protein LSI01_15880 [Furfurilactobacillus siliginis]
MRSERPRQNWLLVTATIIGVLILVMLAFLIGKVMTGNQSSAASSAPRTSSSQSVSSSQSTSSSAATTTSSASQAPERGQKSGSETVGGPYSVSTEELNALSAFHVSGMMNMPGSITLDLNDQSGAGTADFRGPDYLSGSMNVTYYSIPTTSIRIFGAKNHSIRTVKVNSEIRFDDDNPSNELTTSGSMYAFKNRDGGISLAIPNYAGNVDDSERDVLQEVLQ